MYISARGITTFLLQLIPPSNSVDNDTMTLSSFATDVWRYSKYINIKDVYHQQCINALA